MRWWMAMALVFAACSDGVEAAPDVVDASDAVAETDGDLGGSGDAGDVEADGEMDAEVAGPAALKVMTFNVLCSFCNPDEYDPWDERLAYFDDIFERHDPDVIGLQELSFPEEVAQLEALLPGYEAIWFQEPHPQNVLDGYPDATLMIRSERFEVLDSGEYWLSPTPDEPWSNGFATTQFWRLVVWAELREKATDRHLYVASTHFDNNSPSQDKSAPLVVERTQPWLAQMPVVVLGDFNSQPDDPAFQTLISPGADGYALTDAYSLAAEPTVVANQEPPPPWDPAERIDHIFLGGADWTVNERVVDLYVYGDEDRFPSDHWPVAAELAWPPE